MANVCPRVLRDGPPYALEATAPVPSRYACLAFTVLQEQQPVNVPHPCNCSRLPWKQVHRHAYTLPQVWVTCGRVYRTPPAIRVLCHPRLNPRAASLACQTSLPQR